MLRNSHIERKDLQKLSKSILPRYEAYIFNLVSARLIIAFIHYENINELIKHKKTVTRGNKKAIHSPNF
jgi:hypothetical protein